MLQLKHNSHVIKTQGEIFMTVEKIIPENKQHKNPNSDV